VAVTRGAVRFQTGIDEIRSELGARSLRAPVRLIIAVPPQAATPDVEQSIRAALTRYCDMGIRQVDNEIKAIHRDGTRALLVGAAVLAVFLALSELVLQSAVPTGIREFLGNGLFIVAAWVGVWYPVDTLLYAARPCRDNKRVLQAIRDATVVVVSATASAPARSTTPSGECEAISSARPRAPRTTRRARRRRGREPRLPSPR
jgi:hypothetical protein